MTQVSSNPGKRSEEPRPTQATEREAAKSLNHSVRRMARLIPECLNCLNGPSWHNGQWYQFHHEDYTFALSVEFFHTSGQQEEGVSRSWSHPRLLAWKGDLGLSVHLENCNLDIPSPLITLNGFRVNEVELLATEFSPRAPRAWPDREVMLQLSDTLTQLSEVLADWKESNSERLAAERALVEETRQKREENERRRNRGNALAALHSLKSF